MAGNFQVIGQNAATSVQRMTGPQRVTLALAFAATAIGVFLVAKTASNTPMSTLYTGLEATTAASITSELDSQGVPYELMDGGRIIQVPSSQVQSLRLNLAGQGLTASSGGGWGVFDEQGITSSIFEQRVAYQRAMEGELARTIAAIDGVTSANVHLAIPESDLLVKDGKQATASVLLMADASAISPMQVDAIVNLVSSAIEGLSADQVSVADASGQVLAAPGEGNGVVGLQGDTQLRAKRQFEAVLENDLEQLLATYVGPGHAVVNISAELDFNSVVTVTEEYRPNETANGAQVKLGETTREELYRGDDVINDEGGQIEIEVPVDEEPLDGNADGDIDADREAVDDGADADDDASVKYKLDEQDAQYAVDKVITNAENAKGTVTSLSVAVLLDEAVVDADRLAELETLIAAAAGVNADRGDSLAVTLLPMDDGVVAAIDAANEIGEPVAGEAAAGLDIIALARTVGTVIFALVVLILGLRYVSRGSKRKVIESVNLNELEASPVAALGAGEEETEEEAGEPPELKLQSLIANQTDDVADVLRSWLNEAEEVVV
ncbi:MAG: flagellar basal-body MS-ring/collar protein FliF [Acidimicrobiales bacterium]